MNAVDAFSAQMRNMGYSGGPTPTPPSWPNGAPAYPSAPVQPAQPVGQPQQPANQGYWYALPAGNPDRLTVAQVVAKAYKLDATRDATQIQQISDYVAQQNGVMLSNWPIPNNVTGLRLPWAPTNPDTKTKEEKPKKKGPSFGQIVAGIGAVAAGVGRIVVRHNGQDGVPTNAYGVPGYTQPGSGNRDIDNITGDIADVVPILANLGAIFGGNGAQPGYGQIPYGQPGYGQPTYGQPGYYPPNGPSPIPTGTYQPTPPVYQQPQPYNPPIYQPPVYQQPQPYAPPVYQPPVYQQPVYQQPVYQQPQPGYSQPTYSQPTYGQPGTYSTQGGDAWSNQVGTIVNGVGQLAQTIGAIFKR